MWRAGAILCAAFACASAAHAQAPPRVIELPTVRVEGEPRTVEVGVVVDADGSARLTQCSEPAPICRAIERALGSARFEPATLGGRAVAARVRVEVRLESATAEEPLERELAPPDTEQPEPEPEQPQPEQPEPEQPQPRTPDDSPPDDSPPEGEAPLGVTAVVSREPEGAERIELEEAREIPGALGDPFRAVLILPGVVPLIDGLPYFYLRGAPPSGTIYVYDGIVVPALYHLAAGPAVIHPQMVGAIDVHSGVAPARYGNHAGGVVVAEGPRARSEDVFGEAELRALDVNGFASGRAGPVTIAGAARIGYPGLLLSALSPEVDLAYGDYQARIGYAQGGDRLELVGFGSYDSLVITPPGGQRTQTTLQFHRVELRSIATRGATELGFGLRFGHDESTFVGQQLGITTGIGLTLTSVGTRFWIAHRADTLRLRVGGDAVGASGRFFSPEVTIGPNPIVTTLSTARQRFTGNLYAELEWRPVPELAVLGGVRGDLWVTPEGYEAAIDPRLRVVWSPDRALSLHVAGGVARQPSVFTLPLPGLSELPLTNGLVTAVQSELGARARIDVDDLHLTAGVDLFVHHYDNLLLPDLLNDTNPGCNAQGLCRSGGWSGGRLDAISYGGELSLRGAIGAHLAGRLAYTLSRVESDPYAGEATYTPSYDVRHVLNVVLLYDSRAGFTAGVRAFLRSGTVQGFTYVTGDDLRLERYEQRLPAFARLDASVAYAWDAGWARLRVTLEWLNATFAVGGEPQALDCGDRTGAPPAPCRVTRLPPIFFPNLGLRGTFQ